jgi:hypothetical protein
MAHPVFPESEVAIRLKIWVTYHSSHHNTSKTVYSSGGGNFGLREVFWQPPSEAPDTKT